MKAVCSGSFDPVTLGHIDVFRRAANLFDELTVCVFKNIHKKYLFNAAERVELIREATKDIKNIKVDSFDGLVTDYMAKNGAKVLVRGLRSGADLDMENREAQLIHHLNNGLETVLLLTNPKLSYISSSGIRELAAFGGDFHGLVPECVEVALLKKLGKAATI